MMLITDEKGVILAVTIITISVMMVLMASMAPLGTGYYKISKAMSVDRVAAIGLSDIGVNEARWRIHTDTTSDLSPAGSFADAAYDPDPVYMDVDDFSFSASEQDGSDVIIDIGPRTNGVRPITSTALSRRG